MNFCVHHVYSVYAIMPRAKTVIPNNAASAAGDPVQNAKEQAQVAQAHANVAQAHAKVAQAQAQNAKVQAKAAQAQVKAVQAQAKNAAVNTQSSNTLKNAAHVKNTNAQVEKANAQVEKANAQVEKANALVTQTNAKVLEERKMCRRKKYEEIRAACVDDSCQIISDCNHVGVGIAETSAWPLSSLYSNETIRKINDKKKTGSGDEFKKANDEYKAAKSCVFQSIWKTRGDSILEVCGGDKPDFNNKKAKAPRKLNAAP